MIDRNNGNSSICTCEIGPTKKYPNFKYFLIM